MNSPVRLLAILVVAVFAAELSIMVAFTLLPPLPLWFENTLDAFLLVILLTPILYFWLFKLLSLLLTQQMLMATELENANKTLQQDIVELKKIEDELRENENKLSILFESSNDCILILDLEGRIKDINHTGHERLGYAKEEMLGKYISQFDTPEFASKVPARIAELQDKGCATFESAWVRKNGSVMPVEINSRILKLNGQQCIFSNIRDITERKRAKEELRVSENSYRSLFDNMHEGYAHCRMLFEHDVPLDFIYLDVNSEFERLTGLKDVAGKNVSEVIPGIRESNPELFEIYGRVALTGQPEKFESYVEALAIWFSVAVYSPRREHFVAVFDNITERKQVEQELIVLNNQLTHEVAKRTSDLSALTAHIQKIAETEKANLARELHDELGSTLVGISMGIGRLKGKLSAPDLLQDLSLIKDLISNASQISRGVINQLYPTVLDNCGFVAAVDWLVKEYRKHSGIEIELLLPEQEIVVEQTFALAAYRITQECLTNVAKHAGASKVHIEINASDGFLNLTLHDNGKGLSGRKNTGGHGIFGMIERARYLGGSMEIGSEDRIGTTVHLRLPLTAAKPKSRKRVLVVEDHAIVRDALRHLLERQTDDFSVEGEATDGKTAVQMAIEGTWDIMLLDISLPKKNGIQVLEEVMAVKSDLPIIMLSSHPEEEYGDIARSKGAVGYIEKGETGKLVEAMRRATLLQ